MIFCPGFALVLSRDRRVCPGIFAPVFVPGQRDSGTANLFCPGTKGQRDRETFLSRDAHSTLVKMIREFDRVFNEDGKLRTMKGDPMKIYIKPDIKMVPLNVFTPRKTPTYCILGCNKGKNRVRPSIVHNRESQRSVTMVLTNVVCSKTKWQGTICGRPGATQQACE